MTVTWNLGENDTSGSYDDGRQALTNKAAVMPSISADINVIVLKLRGILAPRYQLTVGFADAAPDEAWARPLWGVGRPSLAKTLLWLVRQTITFTANSICMNGRIVRNDCTPPVVNGPKARFRPFG